MSLLTVELICMLLSAWKAPAWVKEIGLIALVTAIIYNLIGISQACTAIMEAGDVSPMLIYGGIKCSNVCMIYGLAIYLVSLVIRIVQKPRI